LPTVHLAIAHNRLFCYYIAWKISWITVAIQYMLFSSSPLCTSNVKPNMKKTILIVLAVVFMTVSISLADEYEAPVITHWTPIGNWHWSDKGGVAHVSNIYVSLDPNTISYNNAFLKLRPDGSIGILDNSVKTILFWAGITDYPVSMTKGAASTAIMFALSCRMKRIQGITMKEYDGKGKQIYSGTLLSRNKVRIDVIENDSIGNILYGFMCH